MSGPDEVVRVLCFDFTGKPANTAFTVLFTESTLPMAGGGEYAYADANPSGSLNDAVNSSGAGLLVAPGVPGEWTVLLKNVGAPFPAGNLQATPVNKEATHCKIADWGLSGPDLKILVRCYNPGGGLVPTRFTLSYHRERSVLATTAALFGYLTIWQPGVLPYNFTAGQTNFNNLMGFNANSSVGVTPYQIKMPKIFTPVDDAQVTAFGARDLNYCTLADLWSGGPDVALRVLCFKPLSSSPTTSGFFISYVALH
jgi:hypothetical protein